MDLATAKDRGMDAYDAYINSLVDWVVGRILHEQVDEYRRAYEKAQRDIRTIERNVFKIGAIE